MEGERSDGTSYLNNLQKPIRHISLLYSGCFLSRSHAYPYHASLCDTLRLQQKLRCTVVSTRMIKNTFCV